MGAIDKVDTGGWPGLWQQVAAHLDAVQAHPARSVLLLPYFQLQAVAKSELKAWPRSFVPRVETTQSWATRLAVFRPAALDIRFDAALDTLTARTWLAQAGLAAKQGLLTPLLLESVYSIAAQAASVSPQQRQAWAQGLRQSSFALDAAGEGFARYEAAVARMALEWAAASAYASDVLFEAVMQTDALVVLRGVQSHALTQRLIELAGDKALVLDLPQSAVGQVHEQISPDFETQAQCAAASVLAHLAAGRTPVALPAIDRQATRRISALLLEQGVAVRDETGWRLSTTRASAALMSVLRAARHDATPDELLDALKHTNAATSQVQAWENALRGLNHAPDSVNIAWSAITIRANADATHCGEWFQRLRQPRTLQRWLLDLQSPLDSAGLWQQLITDEAGQQLIAALHFEDAELVEDSATLSLGEFIAWVQAVCEAASFKPSLQGAAQVVITPLAQLAGRPFAAAVLAGCDDNNLSTSPRSQGLWSRAQREALGLPRREALAAELRAAWGHAMHIPQVDVLWSQTSSDAAGAGGAGQGQQASPLLLNWKQTHEFLSRPESRCVQTIDLKPEQQPAPSAAVLSAQKFSASSYADVRACPYRYFALRLLGLKEAAEIDDAVEKRDFGSWLHAVLSDFHQARPRQSSAEADLELLNLCATAREKQQFAGDAGFIPFAAAWPQVRDAYLLWLAAHEKEGWQFEASEYEAENTLGEVKLQGRLDRVDVLAGSGTRFVIDYKTENAQALKDRVKQPLEDTQLVFYAALLSGKYSEKDSTICNIHAGYLAISEKKGAEIIAQEQLAEALPIFMDGLEFDATRIAEGAALPAHGEGATCEHCAARGLCRKDMWTSV